MTAVDAHLEALDEPRRSEMKRLDALICATLPDYDRHLNGDIIGYGSYHYKYASGREGDWFKVGLCSRKTGLALYICATIDGKYVAEGYQARLPKAKIGKSCVKAKKLADLDEATLVEMLNQARHGAFEM